MTQTYRREDDKNSKKEDKKIKVKFTLTTLKPVHAKWLVVDFYNHMTTNEGEQVTSSGWSAACITNALQNGNLFVGTIGPVY